MASKIVPVGSGNAVFDDQIRVKSILITAVAANATVTVKDGGGVTQLVVAAPANASFQYIGGDGANQYSLTEVIGPVTADVVGAGAFVRIEF